MTASKALGGDVVLQQKGREFLFAMHSAQRALRLYPLENQTVQKSLQELSRVSAGLLESGSLTVRRVGDFFFVNDLRLRLDLSSFAAFGSIGRSWSKHEIGQMEVFSGVTVGDWTIVLTSLLKDPSEDDPFERFISRFPEGFGSIHFERLEENWSSHEVDPARHAAQKTYVQTVAVAREVMNAGRMGRGVTLRRVKRAVQSIVDQVLTNQTSILGMTTLRDYDEYTFTHSVNVCIFAVALGKRLGFGKNELYELGLGGLMHDLGKSRVPIDVLNKPGKLTPDEFSLIKEHPTEGMLMLFSLHSLGELPFRAMLTAYEHHMKVDGTGYPSSERDREISLFSRIIAVADSFDAATTRRVYQTTPRKPDVVLREMQNPAWGLDPILVRAFVGMTGIYPIGSVVILDTYEMAVVVSPNPEPNTLHQPIVHVVYDSMGIPVDPPRVEDLADIDPTSGRPVRSIIKTVDPERHGIRVSDYFV